MSNKLSVSRVVLLGSALASVVLVAAGMSVESKPAWMDLATPVAVVLTLWMLWIEARKFSFEAIAENDSSSDTTSSPIAHLTSDQIRVFASSEDGGRHGWTFQEKIGRLGASDLYLWAEFQGKKWKYDGLNGEDRDVVVPEDMRLFGKVRYLACDPIVENTASKNIVVEKALQSPSALHPALNNTP